MDKEFKIGDKTFLLDEEKGNACISAEKSNKRAGYHDF